MTVAQTMADRLGYTVLAWTQTWSIVDGAHYREAWVRTPDGETKYVGIYDGMLGQ